MPHVYLFTTSDYIPPFPSSYTPHAQPSPTKPFLPSMSHSSPLPRHRSKHPTPTLNPLTNTPKLPSPLQSPACRSFSRSLANSRVACAR